MVFQFRICRRAWLLPSAFFPDHNLQRESAAASAPGGAAALFPTSPLAGLITRSPQNQPFLQLLKKQPAKRRTAFQWKRYSVLIENTQGGVPRGKGGAFQILFLCCVGLVFCVNVVGNLTLHDIHIRCVRWQKAHIYSLSRYTVIIESICIPCLRF